MNADIAVLASKVYELSQLPPDDLDAQKWEALLILNVVYSSATPEGIAAATADRLSRWGPEIEKTSFLDRLHPRWHLRTDDGKPPAVKFALESALDRPFRDLRTRLASLLLIPAEEREPLSDLARALTSDAFNGATGDARNEYVDVMRRRSKTWFREPWLTILPTDHEPPPVTILIDNQGSTHDGGIYDDPADDTIWDKLSWQYAVRNWDTDFLRDNPAAQLFLATESTAKSAASAAYNVAGDALGAAGGAAGDALRGIGSWFQSASYVVVGLGAFAVVLLAVRR